MIKSMTGYGQGAAIGGGKAIAVEMKSVNHRFLDVSVRMPRQYSLLEERFRGVIKDRLNRGRVDIYVKIENVAEAERTLTVDKALAQAYYNSIMELNQLLGVDASVSAYDIAQLPDVIQLENDDDLDKIWPPMEDALRQALEQMVTMRESEGEKLQDDLNEKKATIEKLLQDVEQRAGTVVEDYRGRLKQRISELMAETPVNEERLAAEVAIMADKSNVNEEIVRLKSHLEQLQQTLEIVKPVGRKLDFLVQEMHREINTIGSKNYDLSLGRLVIDIKSEIEKIREQVQNIE
ncbi:YicC family protein [Metallumcola ferriviriculae]|uniref:YicC family protein n=1 Tax=Metallumcola ferriviriculae TaxID=3039180 RepID=A0AAU0UNF0_9FIRM|nr:YicC family protein [Desulfitibacteraceae bacterium MK1]